MNNKELLVLLEKAIRIAVNAHAGQVDNQGVPYILHPLRVMNNVDTIQQKIIAVLHDVIEDTSVGSDTLQKEGFSYHSIVSKIELLSHIDKQQTYTDYIKKIGWDADARKVKLADLRDNADMFRCHDLEEKHIKMIKKYHQAIKILDPTADDRIII